MKTFILALLLVLTSFCCPQVYPEISLIWQVDRKISPEEDWLMELLSGLEITILDDGKFEKFINQSIIVISTAHNDRNDYEQYFQKLHEMNYSFGIILLSDERYDSPTDFYKYAKFVFRNYWHKKFSDQKNVVTFSLGYKSGFWKDATKEVKNCNARNYIWSFAGQITGKPTRIDMIAHIKNIPKYFIHETFSWGDPQALSVTAYQDLLLNTIFVPCPTGFWNLDSFRVYEALECGCIPIVEKNPIDYFANFYGEHPFITIESWDQVPKIINSLMENRNHLEQRRVQCYRWWLDYKKKTHRKFVKIIRRNLV